MKLMLKFVISTSDPWPDLIQLSSLLTTPHAAHLLRFQIRVHHNSIVSLLKLGLILFNLLVNRLRVNHNHGLL